MQDKTAVFMVELYYQGSAAWSRSKPVVSQVTLTEGADLYLEDKLAEHPNLPHFNFRIVEVATDGVTIEQIPDRCGKIQPFQAGAASLTRKFRLEKGKPLRISLDVPGGGPAWTVTWITQARRQQ